MALSVLTLNIWNDDGPWPERAELIRAWIDELDPDLIGFQEVLVGEGRDQARELVGDRYEIAFGRAIDFWRNSGLAFGNAVASRWGIEERESVALPDAGDGERRVALWTSIASPLGPVTFTSTHLNYRAHHGWVRERQVVALAELVWQRRPRGGFPPILVGDFNAPVTAAEIRYMSGLQSLDGRSVHLRDAWVEAGGGGDGLTWTNRNDYARPWLEPERRLDYVFVGPPERPSGVGRVESCRLVCNEPRDGVWPSDHFGVYCELRTEPVPT